MYTTGSEEDTVSFTVLLTLWGGLKKPHRFQKFVTCVCGDIEKHSVYQKCLPGTSVSRVIWYWCFWCYHAKVFFCIHLVNSVTVIITNNLGVAGVTGLNVVHFLATLYCHYSCCILLYHPLLHKMTFYVLSSDGC